MEEPVEMMELPAKYFFIDRRYRFANRSNARTMNLDYPLQVEPDDRAFCRKLDEPFTVLLAKNRLPRTEEISGLRVGDLPDTVLLKVFEYCHPLDLVHCFSKVCKRWNILTKRPNFYKEVRVVLNEQSLSTGSLKDFLSRGSNHIEKLCMYYPKALPSSLVAPLFPDCMPNVTVLDFGCFAEFPDELIERLPVCFPNVATFKMEFTKKFGNLSEEEKGDSRKRKELLEKFFSHSLFPKLQNIRMGTLDFFPEETFDHLCSWQRPIEVLDLFGVPSADLRKLQGAYFKETITELYLEGYVFNEAFWVFRSLKNLKVFSLKSCLNTEDQCLTHLKALNKIESLVLDCCGEDCEFSPEGVARFFTLPNENKSNFFPYNLKHLAITNCHPFQRQAASALVKSCPNLETLNVSGNGFMEEKPFSLIIRSLKKLRFLDISNLLDMECTELRNLSDDHLPRLKFLRIHNTMVDEKVLQKLNLRRKSLLISNRENFIINWTVQDGKPIFGNTFNGDFNAIMNDLEEEPGFLCM